MNYPYKCLPMKLSAIEGTLVGNTICSASNLREALYLLFIYSRKDLIESLLLFYSKFILEIHNTAEQIIIEHPTLASSI